MPAGEASIRVVRAEIDLRRDTARRIGPPDEEIRGRFGERQGGAIRQLDAPSRGCRGGCVAHDVVFFRHRSRHRRAGRCRGPVDLDHERLHDRFREASEEGEAAFRMALEQRHQCGAVEGKQLHFGLGDGVVGAQGVAGERRLPEGRSGTEPAPRFQETGRNQRDLTLGKQIEPFVTLAGRDDPLARGHDEKPLIARSGHDCRLFRLEGRFALWAAVWRAATAGRGPPCIIEKRHLYSSGFTTAFRA